jgi:hypothetical protein
LAIAAKRLHLAPRTGGAQQERRVTPLQSVSPSGPQTYVGLWLRASLLGERDEYRRRAGTLNGGRKGWNDDEPAVVSAACELAVRQFFGTSYEARAISDFVSDMRRKIGCSKTPPGQLDMEALIRTALGEKITDVRYIKRSEILNIQGTVTVNVSDILAFDNQDIDKLLVEAERIARDRGWAPPLAD